MTLKPGACLGTYEIVASIAAGGMGEVYRARDRKLGRDVALKTLPGSLARDPDRVARFTREAQVLAALNHPQIGTIYGLEEADAGDSLGVVQFLLLELVDGETLKQRLSRSGGTGSPFPIAEALQIAVQIAGALAAAHATGVIHRDLKPDNVMLRRDGIVKVLDFGLAKLTEHATLDAAAEAATMDRVATTPGSVMGTASYMSPEQARGEVLDARTDIFSFGLVLYELLTGHPAFEGASALEVISGILKSEPRPVEGLAPQANAELQRIVGKALRKDRDERYQSMKELAVDLKHHLQDLEFAAKGRGTAAPTAGQAIAVPHPSRRWWLLAGAAAGGLLALVGTGLWFRSPAAAIESVAVLPLVNQTTDPELEYLSDGISESLINSLSQLPNLKVMSRNSAFRLKGQELDARAVGQALGVEAVVMGRVLRRGDSLTVSLELVEASDNSQMWGRQYSGGLTEIFASQSAMSRDISQQLQLTLTGDDLRQLTKRPTDNLKAFQFYMQGRSYAARRTHADILMAVEYCEKAIAEDREYALAYAGLADAYAALGVRGYIHPLEGRRKSAEAAETAIRLDEGLAEAHAARSLAYLLFAPYDFDLVDRELARAVALSPSLAMARNYLGVARSRQGRFAEAAAEWTKARELDPLSPIIARARSIPPLLNREYARARDILRQADELGPQFIIPIEIGVYIQNGLFDEALAGLDKAKRDRPDDPMLLYQTGMVHAARGKRAEATAILAQLEARSGETLSQAQWIAKIHAGLNETEQALRWLERGLAAGAIGDFYEHEPVWDPIRRDPRFAAVVRSISGKAAVK
jgi:TolB-like protein/tetratricopeptide (TPR) repeat protein